MIAEKTNPTVAVSRSLEATQGFGKRTFTPGRKHPRFPGGSRRGSGRKAGPSCDAFEPVEFWQDGPRRAGPSGTKEAKVAERSQRCNRRNHLEPMGLDAKIDIIGGENEPNPGGCVEPSD